MFSLRGVFLRKTNIPILFFMTFSFGMGIYVFPPGGFPPENEYTRSIFF
jgi:hypothetical protein